MVSYYTNESETMNLKRIVPIFHPKKLESEQKIDGQSPFSLWVARKMHVCVLIHVSNAS